jgi:phospholipase/lecithinase/hemolysin
MKDALLQRWTRFVAATVVLALPGVATAALSFSSIVVFGTSLSDSGNAFALLAHQAAGFTLDGNVSQNTPPYDTLDESLVPSAPYAKGGHHFTNGATWIEQFARGRGLAADVGPAFRSNSSQARNYAVGGARAIDYPDRVNLPQQVQAFVGDVGQHASSDALYVIEMGNNDIRDALVTFSEVLNETHDQTQATAAATAVIANALNGISENIQTLYTHGARKFLVWNAGRIDLVPAVRALGTEAMTVTGSLTDGFNRGLATILSTLSGQPDMEIAQLDIYTLMTTVVNFPNDYGLTDVVDACVTPNTRPFTCKQPDNFFFWDGIHPTKTVHAIIAQRTADVLADYHNP